MRILKILCIYLGERRGWNNACIYVWELIVKLAEKQQNL